MDQQEEAFHNIRGALPEEQQEQLDLYIGACEAWRQAQLFVAYALGRESPRGDA